MAILALYGLYLVAGMRIRAEAGGQWIFFPLAWNPELAGGEHAWHGRPDAGHAGADADHARLHYRLADPMPFHLETWKMGEHVDLKRRQMIIAFLIGLAVALPSRSPPR